ncbi:MAG: hypothetical protein WC635_14585 [Bacteriovorax sp.]
MKKMIGLTIYLLASPAFADYCEDHNNSITTATNTKIIFKRAKLCQMLIGAYSDCKFSNTVNLKYSDVPYEYCEDDLIDNIAQARSDVTIMKVLPKK